MNKSNILYRDLFRLIPLSSRRFNRGTICYYPTCAGWSSAFYCTSRKSSCKASAYALWQLSHGLPCPTHQLSIF